MTPLLYIKFGAIALIAIVIVGLGWRVRSLSTERDNLKLAVDTVVEANNNQNKVITALQTQRTNDATIIQKYIDDVAHYTEKDRTNRRAIADLEAKNANVRAYLGLPIPPPLRSMLADESSDEAGSGGREATVPTSSALSAPQIPLTIDDFRSH